MDLALLTPLAGVFVALIMAAGSRDAQMVTAMLVLAAIALQVPASRHWVRRERLDEREEVLSEVAATLLPPSHQDTPQSARAVRDFR